MKSYTEEAIFDISNQYQLLSDKKHTQKTIKHILKWLKDASVFRLSNLDFHELTTKHDVQSFSHEDIASLPLGPMSVEIDFSKDNSPSPLPGGYVVPGQNTTNPSSKRISLIVRLSYNRMAEFLEGAGPLTKLWWPKHVYSKGGVLFIPISFIDNLGIWVAAYGCAVMSAMPLPPETPEEALKRSIREARYSEHCTEPSSAMQSPIPYHMILTMPEILGEIPNPEHIEELLLADCNDEFVVGCHFLYAKIRGRLKEETVQKIGNKYVMFAKI